MERLTEYMGNGEDYESINPIDTPYEYGKANLQALINKLAAYEDAEEQGWLLRLPCKVGDTVYAPTRNFVSELRIILISIEKDNVFFHWRLNTGIYPSLNGFTASDIGKMVFLTCEEAEAKLKEMI